MNKNVLWVVFLLIVSLFALWFVAKAAFSVVTYFSMTVQVPTTVEKWSVEEIKSDQFAVSAHYFFEYQGKQYESVGRVGQIYPNPWAAQRAQEQFSKEERPAWLDPKHPDRAVLKKTFPFKKAISALVLMGLLIYFLFLSSYVKVKHG